MPHLIVNGIHWTRFWWYTPDNGWPTTETDVLGGLLYINLIIMT